MILAPRLGDRFPELYDFSPGDGWEVLRELDAVQVKVGPKHRWGTVHEVVNFLRTVIDAERLAELRGGFVPGCASVREQVDKLIGASQLTELAPLDASPLMDILGSGRIESWFQPIFHADSMDVWGYECLMRGRDAAGQLVSPKQILDWARQEQMIFMLDRVCRERHLENAGRAGLPKHANILINFLPTAIYEPAFCLRTTMAAASRTGIDPSRIIFEVVESDQVTDREHLTTILAYYRQHGFRIALDDVGAGYSGLMMLADLNPDLIKIDRALINKAPTSKMHRGVCKALIEMAKESGKLSLAEGVETAQEHELMANLGVDLLQGYLFAKPSPQVQTRSQVNCVAG